MSLTLRLGLLVIGILLLLVLGIGQVFENQLDAALRHDRRAELRLYTERAAEELQRAITHLHSTSLFLAHAPSAQEIREIMRREPGRALNEPPFDQARKQLQQLFLAVAKANPAYRQLRLIELRDKAPERVRVDRMGDDVVVVAEEQLQTKGGRYYVRESAALPAEDVYLSRIDLNHEHGRISQPASSMLRAVTPIGISDGKPVALLVINLDMDRVYRQMTQLLPPSVEMYLVNSEQHFLYHPAPSRVMDFEYAKPHRLEDEFPGSAAQILRAGIDQGRHFSPDSDQPPRVGYAVAHEIDRGTERERLTLFLLAPQTSTGQYISHPHGEIYGAIGVLLAVAILLVALMLHQLTRPLRGLVQVSREYARGNYDAAVPSRVGSEDIARLIAVFRQMATALREREQHLQELNDGLEQQVQQRTRELELTQTRLIAERELQRSILDNIRDGVVAVDHQGNFTLWNDRAARILGSDIADVSPQDWPQCFGLYHSEGGELIAAKDLPLVRALQGETVSRQEIFLRHGAKRGGAWISVFARPLHAADGCISGAVAVIEDIDESRRALLQSDQRSRELARLGRMSLIAQVVDTAVHRLSQPLAASANYIGAAVQLRTAGQLGEQQLDEILAHLNRLAERSGEVIDALRLMMPRSDQDAGHVDLNDIAHKARDLLQDEMNKHKITLEQRLEQQLPKVHGHHEQIYQAVVHLLLNAIDAVVSTQQERRIVLATRCSAASEWASIEVGDNGPGIGPELADKVFTPWFSTKAGALGIGLSVVSSIAESHNGRVGMEDRNDGLTWFNIHLPAEN